MKKNIILSLLVLSIFSPASFANSEMNDLKAGKPVIKETINKTTKATETHLTFLIKSTPQKIWDILMDYEKYPEFMPVKEVKTKSRHGSYDIVFIRPEAPAMFDVSYDLKRTYFKNEWKIAFEKSAGKIKSINGFWKLDPINAKYTKVTYVNNIDIGMPVPAFVKDYFTKGALAKVAESVKKRVETNGKWKK